MKVIVRIPSPLRKFTEQQGKVPIEASTVGDVLTQLFAQYPEIKEHIVEKSGALRPFVNLFVNQDQVDSVQGMETPLSDGNEIRIVPAIAGGQDELSPAELSRYSRHLTLPQLGAEGQLKLKNSKVLVIGAGGLGCPVTQYLTAAGVGTIGIVDHDVVEESNLQRQILFGHREIGKKKVECAKDRLNNLNPYVKIHTIPEIFSSENALDIIKDYDLVIDGTDNFPTRYLVNDACVFLNKPNCYGSIFRFEGQASVFHYKDGPCYRCLYPSPPPPGLVPSCAEGGVLGVLPAIIGSIQATEAIKILTGMGETLSGRLLMFDALDMEFRELKLKRDENCTVCGKHPKITKLIDYKEFCGIPKERTPRKDEMTVQELKQRIDQNNSPVLLDVREDYELQINRLDNIIHIPMNTVPQRIGELNPNDEIVVYCKAGIRSEKVCDFLKQQGFSNVNNLVGGIVAWAKEIDQAMPTY